MEPYALPLDYYFLLFLLKKKIFSIVQSNSRLFLSQLLVLTRLISTSSLMFSWYIPALLFWAVNSFILHRLFELVCFMVCNCVIYHIACEQLMFFSVKLIDAGFVCPTCFLFPKVVPWLMKCWCLTFNFTFRNSCVLNCNQQMKKTIIRKGEVSHHCVVHAFAFHWANSVIWRYSVISSKCSMTCIFWLVEWSSSRCTTIWFFNNAKP